LNGDGSINIVDALTIARYDAGLITTFPGSTTTPLKLPVVYNDNGIPDKAENGESLAPISLSSWGTDKTIENQYADSTAPEGTHSLKLTGRGGLGWSVTLCDSDWAYYHGVDMSAYSGGSLKFWVKTPVVLKVGIMSMDNLANQQGDPPTEWIDNYGWDNTKPDDWQAITIPLDNFVTGYWHTDLSQICTLFTVSTTQLLAASTTVYFDNVRWTH